MPRPYREEELDQNRSNSFAEAMEVLAGMYPQLEESEPAIDALYALYDAAFADGQQEEYSHPR
jgi:hypothetical protein